MQSSPKSSDAAFGWWYRSCLSPCFECCKRQLPLMGIDADEMVLFPFFEERHATAHAGITHDNPRLLLQMIARSVEGRLHGVNIVAIHALREPAKCFELL